MIEERQYQADDVNYAMGHGVNDRVIHCSPTGSGKTVIQALIAKRELDRGNKTAILTPRNEIFSQTFGLLSQFIGPTNVTALRAKRTGETWNPVAPIHVVSWPTLVTRAKRSDWWFPRVDRVLVDECHLAMAPKILEILEHYAPKARIDGYTATPARQTGKGLGRFFTEIKHVTSVRQLIKDGFLAPCEYWGGATPDLQGIRVVRGDYEKKKLSDACVKLVGDAVDNWLRLASDRQTIVFAVDIAHCEMLAHKFTQVGIKAASLHVRLPQDQRDRLVRKVKAGEIQVLVNVSIASYGFDSPEVACVQICRPTKSIVLHLQMIGRGMRPKPNGGEWTMPATLAPWVSLTTCSAGAWTRARRPQPGSTTRERQRSRKATSAKSVATCSQSPGCARSAGGRSHSQNGTSMCSRATSFQSARPWRSACPRASRRTRFSTRCCGTTPTRRATP